VTQYGTKDLSLIPVRGTYFSLSYCVLTGRGDHPAFYPVRSEGLSGIQWPGREADNSPLYTTECVEICNSILPYVLMRCCSVKHEKNYTFSVTGRHTDPVLNK
jgi:hypothetical protein